MSIEDKDFIMRQVRTLAEGLGALLDKKTVKELITYDQEEGKKLSDAEIEAIILAVDVEDRAKQLGLSEVQLAERLTMSLERWRAIAIGSAFPDVAEQEAMKKMLQEIH